MGHTRAELRDGVIPSFGTYFPGVTTPFILVNNLPNAVYFNIEGTSYTSGGLPFYRQIFNSASVTSLVNCTMVTESMHAGFVVNPSSTATFTFAPTAPIPPSHLKFIAANPTVLSGSTTTVYGVEMTNP